MLDIREGPRYKNLNYCDCFDQILRAITDVKLLTLPGWVFKEYVGPWLFSDEHERLIFSRLKDLWLIDNSVEEHKIRALFSFMKFCPSLKGLFSSVITSFSAGILMSVKLETNLYVN